MRIGLNPSGYPVSSWISNSVFDRLGEEGLRCSEKMKMGNISALMFRNKKHSGLNMVYKRDDGLIGWVDPRGNRNLAKI